MLWRTGPVTRRRAIPDLPRGAAVVEHRRDAQHRSSDTKQLTFRQICLRGVKIGHKGIARMGRVFPVEPQQINDPDRQDLDLNAGMAPAAARPM